MSLSVRFSSRLWLIVPILAVAYVVWANAVRLRRVELVSSFGQESVAVDPGSPTGYAGGIRKLLVPGQNFESYGWIIETQQMFTKGEVRLRTVDYDNAPFGREANSPSIYRWWLGLLAWFDHLISARPLAMSVENAALFSDPLLLVLVLVTSTALVAHQFGTFPAVFLSAALATLTPWAGSFLPGAPDHHGPAYVCAMWSVLLLLAGVRAARAANSPQKSSADGGSSASSDRGVRRWFLIAGIIGGIGLWIDLSVQVVTVIGITVGAVLISVVERPWARDRATAAALPLPWRIWAWSGATTCVAAYLLEYAPSHLDLSRIDVIHPVYAISWLALGELLARTRWIKAGSFALHRRDVFVVVLAAIALAAAAVTLGLGPGHGWLSHDPLASRLTGLAGGIAARSVTAWLALDGLTPMAWATFLPLALLGPAVWRLKRSEPGGDRRAMIAFSLGPVLASLVLACHQLRWWSLVDAMLFAVLIATITVPRKTTASVNRLNRWRWSIGAGVALVPGIVLFSPAPHSARSSLLTEIEAEGIDQRDLAQWLARRAVPSGVVALSSAELTTQLCFYGGLRGLGTLAWENADGVTAAVRIASATSPDEALALVQSRGVTHIIVPSWDFAFDNYARLGSGSPGGSFIAALRRWTLPPWVRPVPYQLPKIKGREDRAVFIFEVVEEQDAATAGSRLAEYFVEMGMIDVATAFRIELGKYPSDAGALAALAQVEIARGDKAAFGRIVDTLLPFVSAEFDLYLPLDRQASLAIVFAQAQRFDLARLQVERCLKGLDEEQINLLSTRSLFRLLVMTKGFGLKFPDDTLRGKAMSLLPAELVKGLQ